MIRYLRRTAFCISVLLIGLAAGCAAAGPHRPADGSTVTAADIERQPGEPIEKVLQARVPGLVVRRTADGGIALQIRGGSPFSNNNGAPLYVLNDVPIAAGPDGALPGIDPYDIETIKVLKGAETALYGIQGANGVIVITTKKPGK
jgi:TonB-dependent starch-binding outer membrane protein SusC